MRRLISRSALTLTALTAAAVALSAQESPRVRVQREPRSMTIIATPQIGGDQVIEMRRGRLGITVDMRPDAARDTVGARVAGVTPGGPADHAGVQTGDIVTRFNGTRLVVTEGRQNEDSEQSRPGMRLINLASRIDKGDTVRLDLRRDDRPLTVTFVAAENDMDQVVERMRMPGNGFEMMSPFMHDMAPGDGQVRVFAYNGNLSSLELVKVNPGLGEYFGTSDGLLVVDVGQDSAIGLHAGDVILSIGGRRATSPSQAMRILGTYDANEAVQFEVMRLKRRVTVNGRMPTREQGEWRIRPNSFEFEMPGMGEPMRRMMDDMPRMMEHFQGPDMRHIEIGEPKIMLRTDGKV